MCIVFLTKAKIIELFDHQIFLKQNNTFRASTTRLSTDSRVRNLFSIHPLLHTVVLNCSNNQFKILGCNSIFQVFKWNISCVGLFVFYLPVFLAFLFICLSIYLCSYPCFLLCVSFSLFVFLIVFLFTCLSHYLSVCLFALYLSVCLSICIYILLSGYLVVYFF